jgi:hypothetical protein
MAIIRKTKFRSCATYKNMGKAEKQLLKWQRAYPERDLFVKERNSHGKHRKRYSVVDIVRRGSKVAR